MVGMVTEENSFSSIMVAGSRDSYSVVIVLVSSSARQDKTSAALAARKTILHYWFCEWW